MARSCVWVNMDRSPEYILVHYRYGNLLGLSTRIVYLH